METDRKELLAGYVDQLFMSMKAACNVILEEAEREGIVYPIHGEQLPTPPGAVRDVWRVRWTMADGYARTFDEQRQTLNYISQQLAEMEQERLVRMDAERMDGS